MARRLVHRGRTRLTPDDHRTYDLSGWDGKLPQGVEAGLGGGVQRVQVMAR